MRLFLYNIAVEKWFLFSSVKSNFIKIWYFYNIHIKNKLFTEFVHWCEKYRKNSIKRPYSNKRPSPYLDASNAILSASFGIPGTSN